MTAGVSVAATGSALAFLLFENGNSRNNQSGFLLGDVVSEKKNLISDSDYGEEKTETVIHVHAVVQDESLSSSYTLKDSLYLKSNASKKSVVGWYSFRRNVTAVPTLKNRLIHRQLLEKFRGNPESFLFCLLTASENCDNKCHIFRQHFLVYNSSSRKYEVVPLLIENLANISPQYSGPLPPSGEMLLQDLIDPDWPQEALVDRLRTRLNKALHGAVNELVNSENKLTESERTLLHLRKAREERYKEIEERNLEVSLKEDEEGDVSQPIRIETRKEKVDEGGDSGDTDLNRYNPPYPVIPKVLRGVHALPPASNLRAEAPPFNPRNPLQYSGVRSPYHN